VLDVKLEGVLGRGRWRDVNVNEVYVLLLDSDCGRLQL